MIDIDDSEIDEIPEGEPNKNTLSSEDNFNLKRLISEALKSRNQAEVLKGQAAITIAEVEKEKLNVKAIKARIEFEERRKAAEDRRAKGAIKNEQGNIQEPTYSGIDRRAGQERRTREEELEFEEKRRETSDRRQREALRDEQGNIIEKGYTGPDRRSGKDRRAEREALIRQDYRKLVIRSLTYSAIFGSTLIFIIILLFAPELLKLKEFAKTIDYKAAAEKVVEAGSKEVFLGATLNKYLGKVENYVLGVRDALFDIGTADGSNPAQDIATIKNVLSNLHNLNMSSAEDQASTLEAMSSIKNIVVSAITSDPQSLKKTILEATDIEGQARNILEKSQSKSVVAAGMLFALNEFRNNIYSGNSYESDINLIKKLAGDDPEMNEVIDALLPYAQSGVMNREVLSAELKSLANDIVLAKIQGEEVDIREKAINRFEQLKDQAKEQQLTSNTEEAVVARAQVMLEEGDVEGAMYELQKLKHNPAANKWVDNASKSLIAGESSDVIVEQLIQKFAGQSGFSPESLIRTIMPVNTRPVYLNHR